MLQAQFDKMPENNVEPQKQNLVGLHAVVVPFPSQGHVTTLLQLARKLITVGFRITFVNTTHIHTKMMKSQEKTIDSEPGIQFVSVYDGLRDDHPRLADIPAFCAALLKLEPAFDDLFGRILLQSPVTCVIHDLFFPIVLEAATKRTIPVVGSAPLSAMATHCIYHIPTFLSAKVLPLAVPPTGGFSPSVNSKTHSLEPARSEEEEAARRRPLTCLPGAPPNMQVGDIPTVLLSNDPHDFMIRFFNNWQNVNIPKCACILSNTFYELEASVIDAMSDMNKSILPVGPLVLQTSSKIHDDDDDEGPTLAGAGCALLEEDHKSLLWLDRQSSGSVLYVSFGSVATVSLEQVKQLANGLEMSQQAFLWVVRTDLVQGLQGDTTFQTTFAEFVHRTRDRALFVPWVPQALVLSHPAVAAFLTHCGWNSTVESICTGVPMLCWPQFVDQPTNCFYITHVWNVGLELDREVRTGLVLQEEVERKVRRIMSVRGGDQSDDPEINLIRNNCLELRNASKKAVMKGGSSHTALMDFVQQMKQLASGKKHTEQSSLVSKNQS